MKYLEWLYDELRSLDRLRGITPSSHRCIHGIDLERAACGKCLVVEYNQ